MGAHERRRRAIYSIDLDECAQQSYAARAPPNNVYSGRMNAACAAAIVLATIRFVCATPRQNNLQYSLYAQNLNAEYCTALLEGSGMARHTCSCEFRASHKLSLQELSEWHDHRKKEHVRVHCPRTTVSRKVRYCTVLCVEYSTSTVTSVDSRVL